MADQKNMGVWIWIADNLRLLPFIKRKILPMVAEGLNSSGNAPLPVTMENDKRMKLIAKGSKPIIVGPWLSEVGFEVLYWVPFLTKLMDDYNIDPQRIIIISRGGPAHWYDNIRGKYCDILSYFTPEEFKEKNERRVALTGGQKHIVISEFDVEIINRVTNDLKIEDYDTIHPSMMYDLFSYFWRRQVSIRLIENYTSYRFFRKIPADIQDNITKNLPDSYVAIKFYFSAAFPDTTDNRKFIEKIINNLSRSNYIVVLSAGISLDDHSDFDPEKNNRIINLGPLDPEKNLDIQTKVLSKATAFYGTYGGFSYLAPFYGVPSVSFYSEGDKFVPLHLDVAHRAFRSLKYGMFEKLRKTQKPNYKTNYSQKSSMFIILNINDLEILEHLIR
jgi:hypothetical protein